MTFLFKKYILAGSVLLGSSAFAGNAVAQIQNGESYTTCFPGVENGKIDLTEPVSGIIDTRNPSSALDPTNWLPPKRQGLDATDVGLVFGIAFDQDATGPNVYVANSAAFGLHIEDSSGVQIQNGQADARWMAGQFANGINEPAVFKVDTTSNIVTRFGPISNDGPGFGNIAFNQYPSQNVFYVSDLSNGKIYHLDQSGVIQNPGGFDHAVTSGTSGPDNGVSVDITSPAFNVTTGSTAGSQSNWGVTQSDRLIWGLGVHKLSTDADPRLYYSVGIGGNAKIYSVKLDSIGNISALSADIRDENVDLSGINSVQIITDIAFSANDEMLLAERGGLKGTFTENILANGYTFYAAHSGRVTRFVHNGINWSKSPSPYYDVGIPSNGRNSAGGVDFSYGLTETNRTDFSQCDATFEATGDYLASSPLVYGIQLSPLANTGNVLPQSYFIDLDGSPVMEKTQNGDVEVYRQSCMAPPEPVEWDCASIEASGVCAASSLGGPNTHSVSLDITHDVLGSNTNNLPITDIKVSDQNGNQITPIATAPALPLLWGNSTTATFDVPTNVDDEQVCLTVEFNKPDENAMMTPINGFCCTQTICVDLPPCENCLDLQGDYLVKYNSLVWPGSPYNVSIEGTICSDNITIDNLTINVDSQAMTLDNIIASGGNCFDFEASYSSPNSLIPGGFEFDFSASSQEGENGVSQCCSDSLTLTDLNESDPNIDNTSTVYWDPDDWILGDVIAAMGGSVLTPEVFTQDGVTRLEKQLRANYQMPEGTRLMLGKQVIYHIGENNRILSEVSMSDILALSPKP